MAITIENNGASIKITEDGASRFVFKNQIRDIEIVRDTILKMDTGQGALNNIFIDQVNVTSPISASAEDLRNQLNDFIQSNSSFVGVATEANQFKELDAFKLLQNTVNALSDKIFYEPILVDESNLNAVYNGFALPGAKATDAVWAIQKVSKAKSIISYQWASGNKNFDKVWNNRTTLIYS